MKGGHGDMKYKPFGLGVTLYSFNVEYYKYTYTFEDMLALASTLGEGQGVEIVAPMFDRKYPDLSPEFEHRVRNGFEKFGLVPICYSGYSDPQRIYGRYVTDDEMFEYLKPQLDATKKLGFPLCRTSYRLSIADKLAQYCEKLGIKLGVEIHAPQTIETSEEILELCRRWEGILGIVPDCGIFCRAPSDVYLKRFADQGVPKEISDMIVDMWTKRADLEDIMAEVKSMGGNELCELMATESYIYFGHSDPAVMKDAVPYIIHMHGKFFNINEKGEELAVRIPEIVKALQEGGYAGYMSSEYEGHHWFADLDSFEQIKRHQALVRSYFK